MVIRNRDREQEWKKGGRIGTNVCQPAEVQLCRFQFWGLMFVIDTLYNFKGQLMRRALLIIE